MKTKTYELVIYGALTIVVGLFVMLQTGCGQPQASISSPMANPAPVIPLPATNTPDITVVQFCQGAANYPTTFPEVGFCIQGNVYAVYSANDGFLTLIPPGAYTSNAIGSSCDFTVLTNCVINTPGATFN